MWGGWQPSALFYVTRAGPLRVEPLQNWQRLKEAYESLALREKEKYPVHVISNDAVQEEALQQISQIFAATLKKGS
jgi:thymidylate kinase